MRGRRPGGRTLLAVDTSGPHGSVALGRDGDVLAQAVLERRGEQASMLVPTIDRVLGEAGTTRGALEGLVVGEGPGSFTGVRVAAATAKGLTAALGVPLWAVSSLAAAALVAGGAPVRYALFDARADRVYGACYEIGPESVRTLVEPHGGTVAELLAADVPAGAEFVGDGAVRHREVIEGAGHAVACAETGASLARGLLAYLARRPDLRPVRAPADWEPVYVRPSSAVPSWSP